MNTREIARQLHPFCKLLPEQLEQTAIYLELLLKWNAKINLTAVRTAEEMVTRHFGESFFAAQQIFPATAKESVIDLGSGAGFPGLPLAIVTPNVQVTLIEANTKKATFLNEVISRLGFKHVRVVHQRGEDFFEMADVVTMRAIEKFEKSLSVAFRLVRPKGRLALMIGSAQATLAKSVLPGINWQESIAIPESHSRILLTGIKSVATG